MKPPTKYSEEDIKWAKTMVQLMEKENNIKFCKFEYNKMVQTVLNLDKKHHYQKRWKQ